MKTCFLLLGLLFAVVTSAQNVKTAIIKIDTSEKGETFAIPYSQIKILDARFDHTKIGCCYNSKFLGSISTEKFDAKFPDSFPAYFSKFLKTFIELEPSNKDQLIILIKQFRIADHFVRGIKADPVEVEQTLKISASFYALHGNRCFKLFSVDNILLHNIQKFHERKRKIEEGSRPFALREMLYRLLQSQNWQLNTSQPSFTLSDMELAIQKRFDLPLYTSTLKKGVYKSFSDFINNTPSTGDFKVFYKKGGIDHLEDKNGNDYQTKGIWGICDGSKNYMLVRDQLVELIPNDRSFRVFTYVTFYELAGSVGGYDLFSSTLGKLKDETKVHQYFDLDMETGRLYLQEIFGKVSIPLQ